MARRSKILKETLEEVVDESAIQVIEESKDESLVEDSTEEKEYTVVCDGYLRVRRSPSADSEVVDMIEGNEKGNKVTVIEINNKWAKIGPNRWVMREFLK